MHFKKTFKYVELKRFLQNRQPVIRILQDPQMESVLSNAIYCNEKKSNVHFSTTFCRSPKELLHCQLQWNCSENSGKLLHISLVIEVVDFFCLVNQQLGNCLWLNVWQFHESWNQRRVPRSSRVNSSDKGGIQNRILDRLCHFITCVSIPSL